LWSSEDNRNPFQWVSRQLGHSGVSVTQRHHAKYLGVSGDEFIYVEPLPLEPGEIPADLLSRLQNCSQFAHKDDPFTISEFLRSAESKQESSRFSVDSRSEAIVTLVRATDFKSGGGCGDTASAGSIPVRFRHLDLAGEPLSRLAGSSRAVSKQLGCGPRNRGPGVGVATASQN